MTDSISAYPLCWPAGWQRTASCNQTRARFSKKSYRSYNHSDGGYITSSELSVSQGIQRVLETLEKMGVDDLVISTNIPVRLDGLPRSNTKAPEDRGAAVYWSDPYTGARRCMAVDRYDRVADNIAAIAATLEAMRAIERHGGAEILDRAFTGFTALPSPEQWWHVLGFETAKVSHDDVQTRYRELAHQNHPDRPDGDTQAMARINAARDAAIEAISL